MKSYIKESYLRIKSIYKSVFKDEQVSVLDKIKHHHIADSTKSGYISVWNNFTKWIDTNKKRINAITANAFLSQLSCGSSTLKRKQNILQKISQISGDENIKLNPVNVRIVYKPKYGMNDQVVIDFLIELKSKSIEYYLISKLSIEYALRINTIAQLQKSICLS